MFNGKKIVAVLALAATMSVGSQFAEPPKAEANFLASLAANIIKGQIEREIHRNYKNMNNNYYAAAYYSSYAADCGSKLLSKYGASVEMEEEQLIDVSTDNSSAAIEANIKNMKTKSFKTDVTDFDAFANKIDADDPMLKDFVMYRKCQRKALNEANTAMVALIAEQAVLNRVGAGAADCVRAAIQYQNVRNALARESDNVTMSSLEKTIDARFKNIKISEKDVENAIKNVSKG